MSKPRVLHCMHAEKFVDPFVDFVNANFPTEDHLFLISQSGKYPSRQRENTRLIHWAGARVRRALRYVLWMNQADKILLHSLFERQVVFLLFLQPWLLKRCYWLVWGGDLYCYLNFGEKPPLWSFERIRRSVIRRMGHFITHIKGDYDLAREWYQSTGRWHECFLYPSNLYKELALPPAPHDGLHILLGNSADPSNNHLEILDKLRSRAQDEIRIYCPLSYGNQEYAQQVIDYGQSIFGDKFVALRDFMSAQAYLELLAVVDVAIFNHKRQQGMGNIVTLLGLGKKVYVRSDISTWGFIKDLGATVFDARSSDLNLLPLDEATANANKDLIKSYFSSEKLVRQYQAIFQ